MVAVVNAGYSLRNILQYNENKTRLMIDEQKKVQAATLIHASGFAKDLHELRFQDKLKTFEKLTSLNEATKLNAIHISLNFDPSEKGMPASKLQDIAVSYMQQIGFVHQPFLVYKHEDASHPHIHIVTTNIQTTGKRIKLHNIGRNQSEKARKKIEQVYNLVRAEQKQRLQQFELQPINIKRLNYGQSPDIGTKRAITNVLDFVLSNYKFTSLPELNAVLKQYNVIAHQGGKESRTYQRNGLYYQVLGENGKQIGKPIPASDFYNKPTMNKLRELFAQKEVERLDHKRRVKNVIDLHLLKKTGSTISQLEQALRRDSIQLVVRQNDQGTIYGLTYIDHKTKCVFNGSDIGKEYSANRMQERLLHGNHQMAHQTNQQKAIPKPSHMRSTKEGSESGITQPLHEHIKEESSQQQHHSQQGGMPAELSQDLRRRRKKKLRY